MKSALSSFLTSAVSNFLGAQDGAPPGAPAQQEVHPQGEDKEDSGASLRRRQEEVLLQHKPRQDPRHVNNIVVPSPPPAAKKRENGPGKFSPASQEVLAGRRKATAKRPTRDPQVAKKPPAVAKKPPAVEQLGKTKHSHRQKTQSKMTATQASKDRKAAKAASMNLVKKHSRPQKKKAVKAAPVPLQKDNNRGFAKRSTKHNHQQKTRPRVTATQALKDKKASKAAHVKSSTKRKNTKSGREPSNKKPKVIYLID